MYVIIFFSVTFCGYLRPLQGPLLLKVPGADGKEEFRPLTDQEEMRLGAAQFPVLPSRPREEGDGAEGDSGEDDGWETTEEGEEEGGEGDLQEEDLD